MLNKATEILLCRESSRAALSTVKPKRLVVKILEVDPFVLHKDPYTVDPRAPILVKYPISSKKSNNALVAASMRVTSVNSSLTTSYLRRTECSPSCTIDQRDLPIVLQLVHDLYVKIDPSPLVLFTDTHYGPVDRTRWSTRVVDAVTQPARRTDPALHEPGHRFLGPPLRIFAPSEITLLTVRAA